MRCRITVFEPSLCCLYSFYKETGTTLATEKHGECVPFKMAVFWVVAPCRLVWPYINTSLHGATTQKTAKFIIIAMRTSSRKCVPSFPSPIMEHIPSPKRKQHRNLWTVLQSYIILQLEINFLVNSMLQPATINSDFHSVAVDRIMLTVILRK
jgi:hypothetical protein